MSSRLDTLARRSDADTFFLGGALTEYGRSEGLDDDGLARALGCPAALLARVRLCRRPRSEPSAFVADVDRIAAHFGLDPGVLADVVRRSDALVALREVGEAGGAGLLQAARDRTEEAVDDDDEGDPS